MKAKAKGNPVMINGVEVFYVKVKSGNKTLAMVCPPCKECGRNDWAVEFYRPDWIIGGLTLAKAIDETKKYCKEFYDVDEIAPDSKGYDFDMLCMFGDPLLS